ncbi:hypothetical protein G3A40_36130 [Paraburkholderia aspalathi]|uniref:hypothetical protein n=1 Tax=Paraburkholderia aspalathi TaxID=1324617 RepID=UPI00190CDBF1|nr:hypothetical protein [Paraburkholderia aspalathi]MBK3865186.1 hypothetical protein [Paraburkholderia aspalathi]
MLGIDAAEENMRSFPARLVAQALTEPGLPVFDPALANTPFDWKNADVSPAAIAATRYGMRVVTAEQSFKDLELDQANVAFTRGTSFNPVTLKNQPGGVDSLVTLLGNVAGVTLSDEQRTTLHTLIDALPEHATMADLIRAVKTAEAAQLGIPLEHYDALAPLFDALLKK